MAGLIEEKQKENIVEKKESIVEILKGLDMETIMKLVIGLAGVLAVLFCIFKLIGVFL